MFHFTGKHRTTGSTVVVPSLNALALAANSIIENSTAGTVVGGIINTYSGSVLSLTNDAGGRFAISGTSLVAGVVATDYESATSHSVTILETVTYSGGTVTRSTTLTINVVNIFEKPSLGVLSFSSTSFTTGSPSSGTIDGATTGSSISAVGLPACITINGPARTWSYDGTGSAATSSFVLTETLSDSANSPRNTTINYSIIAGSLPSMVLTETSTAGTNPPTWTNSAAGLRDGDTVELYYTTDGSTPTATGSPQGSITYDSRDETISWGASWPNPFPGGVTIKWAERYGRIVGGTMIWSPLSNVLTDTMPSSGGVFVPIASTPAGQTSTATTHTFPSIATGAGKVVVGVSAYYVSSVILRPTGTTGASDITLTLIADVDASRRDATIWWTPSNIAAGNYDWIINHSSTNSDCAVFGGTVTGATTAGSSFGSAFGVSTTDYAGTVPTLATGAIYVAVAHTYNNATENWSGAATPTKDAELQYGTTMSFAHGSTAGDIHCVPSPGNDGAMAGVVLNP